MSGPSPPRPGLDFQSSETRKMQGDDGANPGMLWVEQGAALWRGRKDLRRSRARAVTSPRP